MSRLSPSKMWLHSLCLLALLSGNPVAWAQELPVDAKLFEGHTDIGKIKIPGAIDFDAAKKEWRITAAGENIWAKEDAFHFAWRKVEGDATITVDIGFVGEGKNVHRKAGPMVRQGLDADAPYVGASLHGDGLITMHYRKEKGGVTLDLKAPFKGPAKLRLEKHGDVYSVSVAKAGQDFTPVGALTIKLAAPVYAGLFSCSHEVDHSETAVFTALSWKIAAAKGQKRVQETSLEIMDIQTGERKVIYKVREKFEAPNWTRDGKLFYVNRGGFIYTLPVQGGTMTRLDTGDATGCNNDHGLSPDGQWLAISHGKGNSQISIVPSAGGSPRKLTFGKEPSYWHGWSPDGKTLVYCATQQGVRRLRARGGWQGGEAVNDRQGPRRWARIFARRQVYLF